MTTSSIEIIRPIVETAQDTANRERRRHERRAMRSPAFLAIPGFQSVSVRTLDVSISGLAIVASINVSPSLLCAVRFVLPEGLNTGKHTIATAATVTHSVFASSENGFKIGLAFRNMPEELMMKIDRFVKMNAPVCS